MQIFHSQPALGALSRVILWIHVNLSDLQLSTVNDPHITKIRLQSDGRQLLCSQTTIKREYTAVRPLSLHRETVPPSVSSLSSTPILVYISASQQPSSDIQLPKHLNCFICSMSLLLMINNFTLLLPLRKTHITLLSFTRNILVSTCTNYPRSAANLSDYERINRILKLLLARFFS